MVQPIQAEHNTSRDPAKKKLLAVSIVIVAAVLIASAAGAFYFESVRNHSAYHVATATQSDVNQASGSNMTKTSSTYSPGGNYTITSSSVAEYAKFVNGSSNPNGTILLGSIEFSTQAEATSYYNAIYSNESASLAALNVTVHNGTYGGFSYFNATFQGGSTFPGINLYEYIAVGHAGRFLFVIVDVNVPMTNPKLILDGQINAMS